MDIISRLPGKSNITNKIPIRIFKNKMKKKAIVAKFIIVIVYD